MKKVLSVLLVALMLASVLAVGASAVVRDDGLNHDYGEIANVERRSIRLDAIKDSAYDEAEEIEINTVSANSSAPAEGRTLADAVAYVVYDSEYIWVFVEVNDASLVTKAAGPLQSGYQQDSIELVFDFANKGEDKANESPYQCRLTHEGYISARIGQKGTTLQGTYEQGSPNPVSWLDGFALHTTDAAGNVTGYNCEFKVTIPEGVEIGDEVGMNIMINDYDENGGSRIMITSNSTDPVCDQWKANLYGNITLDDSDPYTADTAIIYVAVAMVAVLAIGSVTLVSLKKKAK